MSASLGQLRSLWRLREEVSEAQRADGPHLTEDISLPIESIPSFMTSMEERLRARYPGIRPFVFGHFGDGNLHYNLSRPLGANPAWALDEGKAVNEEVMKEVARYNGSISAEHGIGQLKIDAFLALKSPLEVRLMRAIKQVFDPSGIMNPGKLL